MYRQGDVLIVKGTKIPNRKLMMPLHGHLEWTRKNTSLLLKRDAHD